MTFSFPEPLGCSDRRRNRNKRRLETRIRSQDWSEVRETIFAHLVSLCLSDAVCLFFCFGLFINTMPISIDSHERICCLKFVMSKNSPQIDLAYKIAKLITPSNLFCRIFKYTQYMNCSAMITPQ